MKKATMAIAVMLIAALGPVSVARADQRLADAVARTGVWGNTSSGTPAVYGSGAAPCWSDVAVRTNDANLTARYRQAPLSCRPA